MAQIPKVFIGFIMLALTVIAGLGIISVQSTRDAAKEYVNIVANEIENSNFDSNVIAACIAEGEKNDYKVSVQVFNRGSSSKEFSSGLDTTDVYMANISCTYKLNIPFATEGVDKTTFAVAR